MSKKLAPVLGRAMLKTPGAPGFCVASSTMSLPNMGRLERLNPELSSGPARSCASRLTATSKGMPRSTVRSWRMVDCWLKESTHSTCTRKVVSHV